MTVLPAVTAGQGVTVINSKPIPMGCICSYTWGLSGQAVRNGAMRTCPADHGDD